MFNNKYKFKFNSSKFNFIEGLSLKWHVITTLIDNNANIYTIFSHF